MARRDTLWGIAQRHLGDPLRYPEIADLNPTKVGPDNQIQPGAVLRMPADATGLAADHRGDPPPPSGTITVRPGDTLWDLARAQTGDGQNWRQLWRANRDRAEPNSEHLTNPDLIRPGWTLERPAPTGRHPQTAHAGDHTTTRQPQVGQGRRRAGPDSGPVDARPSRPKYVLRTFGHSRRP